MTGYCAPNSWKSLGKSPFGNKGVLPISKIFRPPDSVCIWRNQSRSEQESGCAMVEESLSVQSGIACSERLDISWGSNLARVLVGRPNISGLSTSSIHAKSLI